MSRKNEKEPTYFIKDEIKPEPIWDTSITPAIHTFVNEEPTKIVCPHCGEEALVDTSVVLTSYPPQYSYHCPHCGKTGYIFCHDVGKHQKVTQKCLICGEEREVVGATETIYVCDKCKAAVMVARKIHGIN